jgi:hypothetical protein
MPHRDPRSDGQLGAWLEEDEELRCLWKAFYSASQQEAQDVQQRVLERAGAIERRKKMVSKHRVNRLRALGNAVVPACAEVIARAILAAEEQGA